MAFARQAEEICRSDRLGMDFAETEQQVVSAVAATGLTLLEGLIEARDDGAGTIRCIAAAASAARSVRLMTVWGCCRAR